MPRNDIHRPSCSVGDRVAYGDEGARATVIGLSRSRVTIRLDWWLGRRDVVKHVRPYRVHRIE